MSFLTQEESIESGAPVELYLFQNLEQTFTYTSSQFAVNFSGRDYDPQPISRSGDDVEQLDEQRKVVVKMPADDPFVARYFATVPAQQDQLTIFKYHTTDGGTPEVVTVFKGKVANVAVVGDEAQVNALSDASILQRICPQQTCRYLCNHMLYGPRCQVVDTQFRITVNIDSISSDGLTLGITGLNVVPETGLALSAQLSADSTFFDGGTVERGSLERRSIRSITDLGGNQATIVIRPLPFVDINVGADFFMYAGCDHDFTTCRTRFNNKDRYGGFPYVPRTNPFNTGVDI